MTCLRGSIISARLSKRCWEIAVQKASSAHIWVGQIAIVSFADTADLRSLFAL
jgi:hypothetical protein